MTEKIDVDVLVFLLLHIYRRYLLPLRHKMCPILDVPLTGENIYFFVKKNVLDAYIKKKIHITKSYKIKFLVNIWNHRKNLQDLSSKNPCLNGGLL